MRTKRTNGMDTYTYFYNGSQLVRLIVDAQEYFDFYFTYDASGTPLTVTENGYTYYYVTNLQGDVIGIKDSSGNQVVSYAYDAWGNLLDRTNTQLADYNPLRYRGYVYDFETGLYYLQSRYYNPEWGRFINADIFYSTGQGFTGNNMFAYCLNNPVNMVDHDGEDAIYVTDKKLGRGLPIVGHAIVYIQDSNGEWYMTDYMGQFPDKTTATIRLIPANMDAVNSMLNNEYIPHINYVHLEGDFSASVTKAEDYKGTNYNGYNLLYNNCKDYTQEILDQGTYDNVFESMVVNHSTAMAPVNFGIQLSLASKLSNAWNRAKNFVGGLWDEFTSWLK